MDKPCPLTGIMYCVSLHYSFKLLLPIGYNSSDNRKLIKDSGRLVFLYITDCFVIRQTELAPSISQTRLTLGILESEALCRPPSIMTTVFARNPYHLLSRKEEEVIDLLEGKVLLTGAEMIDFEGGQQNKPKSRVQRKQPKDVPLTIRYIFLEDEESHKKTVSDKARFQQQLLQMKAARKVKFPGPVPADDKPVIVRHVVLQEGGDIEEVISDSGQVRQMLRHTLARVDPLNRKVLDINFPTIELTGKT
ncbi:hypothetical protein R1flu_010400 [Riccia fluitans]|uniref:Uncharacterized protein n=1 Tax=Riccia fluitans TaxID=41844 RepID=A0ABD1Z5S3_9MARC